MSWSLHARHATILEDVCLLSDGEFLSVVFHDVDISTESLFPQAACGLIKLRLCLIISCFFMPVYIALGPIFQGVLRSELMLVLILRVLQLSPFKKGL